jgi:hypothetical protein
MTADADDAAAWAQRPWRERWRMVARYKYRLLDGTVAYEHVRWATRHPSGVNPDDGTPDANRPKTFRYRYRNVHGATCMGLPPGVQTDERLAHLIYQLPILRSPLGACEFILLAKSPD